MKMNDYCFERILEPVNENVTDLCFEDLLLADSDDDMNLSSPFPLMEQDLLLNQVDFTSDVLSSSTVNQSMYSSDNGITEEDSLVNVALVDPLSEIDVEGFLEGLHNLDLDPIVECMSQNHNISDRNPKYDPSTKKTSYAQPFSEKEVQKLSQKHSCSIPNTIAENVESTSQNQDQSNKIQEKNPLTEIISYDLPLTEKEVQELCQSYPYSVTFSIAENKEPTVLNQDIPRNEKAKRTLKCAKSSRKRLFEMSADRPKKRKKNIQSFQSPSEATSSSEQSQNFRASENGKADLLILQSFDSEKKKRSSSGKLDDLEEDTDQEPCVTRPSETYTQDKDGITRIRQFQLTKLQIGNFKVTYESRSLKNRNALKISYLKCQLSYKFEKSFAGSETKIFSIIVPFSSITAIEIGLTLASISMDVVPRVRSGCHKGEWRDEADVTEGELTKTLIHILTFVNDLGCSHFKRGLIKYNETCSKSYGQMPISLILKESDDAIDVNINTVEEAAVSKSVCCPCRKHCRAPKCPCSRDKRKCATADRCACRRCANPLNTMESMGYSLEKVMKDACLMWNIFGIEDIRKYIENKVVLPCCQKTAEISQCIPGIITCPYLDCNTPIFYSWCFRKVMLEKKITVLQCQDCKSFPSSEKKRCRLCQIKTSTNKCLVLHM